MKKWIYFIVPLIGLSVFLFFYFTHVEGARKRAETRKVQMEQKAADEAAKKKDLEDRARQDAERLAAQRAADEKAKQDKRIADQAAEDKKVKDATDQANAECDKSSREIARLDKELATLRAAKDKANRDFLEISKQLELARIGRRTAEIQVQTMTEMIARKAADAAMAKFVPPVTKEK